MLHFVTFKVTKRSTLGYDNEHRLQKGATCSFRNIEGYKKEHLRLRKGAQVTKRSKMLHFVTLKVRKRSTLVYEVTRRAQVTKRNNMLLFVTLKVTKRSTLGYEKEHRLQKGARCSIS
jgi:hypothetical protein